MLNKLISERGVFLTICHPSLFRRSDDPGLCGSQQAARDSAFRDESSESDIDAPFVLSYANTVG